MRESLLSRARGLQGFRLRARGRGQQQHSWQTEGGSYIANVSDRQSPSVHSIPPLNAQKSPQAFPGQIPSVPLKTKLSKTSLS